MHNPAEEFALTPDDPAYFYPFLYDDEEFPDLMQSSRRNMAIPWRTVGLGTKILDRRGADADLQHPERMTHGSRGPLPIASATSRVPSIRSTTLQTAPAPAATMRCS